MLLPMKPSVEKLQLVKLVDHSLILGRFSVMMKEIFIDK